ncbi:unnamed protein product, partial [Didymodactylos carnosus]
NYILFTLSYLSESYILVACLDRYALSSSRVQQRCWSSLKNAKRVIPIFLACLWFLISIHMIAYSKVIRDVGRFLISVGYALFVSLHSIIVSSMILPTLMVHF